MPTKTLEPLFNFDHTDEPPATSNGFMGQDIRRRSRNPTGRSCDCS